MDKELKEWRENGKHLPDFLKDFHDQKDFFKLLSTKLDVSEHEYLKNISSIEGHAYVVDAFLWFLAKYGYSIQKNKTRLNFENLQEDIDKMREEQAKIFLSIIQK